MNKTSDFSEIFEKELPFNIADKSIYLKWNSFSEDGYPS